MGVFVFIVGLAIGSFLNAYIWRTRPSAVLRTSSPLGRGKGEGISVWKGRSMCTKCKKTLHWHELIPLVSFLIQQGRCRGCKKPIDWQYPLVELITGILFVVSYELGIKNQDMIHNSLFLIHQAVSWYLFSVLVILFVFDLRYGLVPDRVVLPAIVVAFVSNVILSASEGSLANASPTLTGDSSAFGLRMTWWGILLAIAVGALFFSAQYYLSKGRWLGSGDIRIGALMGAMLGWPLIFEGLVVSYMIGGIVALLLLAVGKKKFGQTVPLGTFLTFGTVIAFLYGQQIWGWYWR